MLTLNVYFMRKSNPNRRHIQSFEEFRTGPATTAAAAERPRYTGRYFAVLRETPPPGALQKLFEAHAGLRLASSRDFVGSGTAAERDQIDGLYYEHLGVVLVDGEKKQLQMLTESAGEVILQPERFIYSPMPKEVAKANVPAAAWGVQAIGATASGYTGKGVRMGIIDTGFDLNHPDFVGRTVVTQSFVRTERAQDVTGHGTHFAGTAVGRQNSAGTRYGIAGDSELYMAKVFDKKGSAPDRRILDAITWATDQGCRVLSMSLGAQVLPNQGIDVYYERAGKYALDNNCVVVAAAGNESARSAGAIAPVDSPANCPSFLAVAAVDQQLAVADFSCAGINPGQNVDIAAPGVGIYSTWPVALVKPPYHTISGTSMATPHVAGVLALLWEKYPKFTAAQIVSELRRLARPLPGLHASDVGVGLLQSP